MSVIKTSMRLDRELLDEAVKVLGAKSRSEAIDMALRQFLGKAPAVKPSHPKIESSITPA
jgi:metal-responsive CopG/Arc/MetJ family transcriptional regulator